MDAVSANSARIEIAQALSMGNGRRWVLTWEKRDRVRILDVALTSIQFRIERHPHCFGLGGTAEATDVRVVTDQLFELDRGTRQLRLVSEEFIRIDANWRTLAQEVIASTGFRAVRLATEDLLLSVGDKSPLTLRDDALKCLMDSPLFQDRDNRVPVGEWEKIGNELAERLLQILVPHLEVGVGNRERTAVIMGSCGDQIEVARTRVLRQALWQDDCSRDRFVRLMEHEIGSGELGEHLRSVYPRTTSMTDWSGLRLTLASALADGLESRLNKSLSLLVNEIAKRELDGIRLEAVEALVIEHVLQVGCNTPVEARRYAREAFRPYIPVIPPSVAGLDVERIATIHPAICEEMFNLLWDRIRSRCLPA